MQNILKFIYNIFIDLINIFNPNKPARPIPAEQEDRSWHKYYKYAEWRGYVIKEVIENVVIILILLIFIREGFGEFRFIPSESMQPTLEIGDKLFVEKFSKRFRKEFNRGDIVIFYPPENATDGKDVVKNDPFSIFARATGLPFLPQPEAYIKRIIGMPGDSIEIKANQGVYINGELIEEPYHEGSPFFLPHYNMPAKQIPPKNYFVLGDNRNYSADSHIWGFLPRKRIIGRAAFLIYRPLNEKPSL